MTGPSTCPSPTHRRAERDAAAPSGQPDVSSGAPARCATVRRAMSTFDERGGSKWDRAARYLKIAQVLHAHGEAGISAAALARQIGVSKRTIYRDLEAMDLDAGLAIWNDGGRFGLEAGAFLPPLALTLPEAMAFFLAARLLTKATDELDPEIIGAFVKLAQVLPPVLAEQLHETADAFADTPRDEAFTRVLRTPHRGAGRAPRRRDRVHGRGLRPLQGRAPPAPAPLRHRALRADARPLRHRLRRGAPGPPHLQGRAHPLGVADTGDASRPAAPRWPPRCARPGTSSATTPPVRHRHPLRRVAWRSAWPRRAGIPARSQEPQPDGSLLWRARVSGVLEIRSWILGWGPDAEVLEPADLREWVAAQHAEAAARYALRTRQALATCRAAEAPPRDATAP